jgi:hypothetical protein
MPEEPPASSLPRTPRPPRKRSPRTAITPHKRPGMAEAQRRLWSDPTHRARMIAARRRSADERRNNPHLYSRVGIPDGMRKAEALKAWDEAGRGAAAFLVSLETQGIVGCDEAISSSSVPETDEGKAKLALYELAKIALGPYSGRVRIQAARYLLAYTKALPAVRREIGITAEDLLALVQSGGDTITSASTTNNANT